MTQYAARYRAARAYADLTQEALARELGVEVQTIKRREAGEKEPKKAELIAVAAICKVPLEFLEHGWGHLSADEITTLLRTQNQILEDIRAATSAQHAAARQMDQATRRMEAANREIWAESSRPAPRSDQAENPRSSE